MLLFITNFILLNYTVLARASSYEPSQRVRRSGSLEVVEVAMLGRLARESKAPRHTQSCGATDTCG
jgi:hypothetical protein